MSRSPTALREAALPTGQPRDGVRRSLPSRFELRIEREAWSSALEGYHPLAERNLLFDEGMVAINVALAGAKGSELPLGLPDGVGAALERATPAFNPPPGIAPPPRATPIGSGSRLRCGRPR